MALPPRPKYFVRRLTDEDDGLAPAGAEFELQILNRSMQGETIAFIARDSNTVLKLLHARKGLLPVESHGIPEAVIIAARRVVASSNDYLDKDGNPTDPGF